MRLVTLSLGLVEDDDFGEVLLGVLLDVGGEGVHELIGEMEFGGVLLSVGSWSAFTGGADIAMKRT